MDRNFLYFIIGVLIIAVIGLGIYLYKVEQQPSGIELKLGEDGVSIEQK